LGGRSSRKTQIIRRQQQLQKTFSTCMHNTRTETINQLETLFKHASALARGKIKYTYDAGKREPITLPKRKQWLLVAKQTAYLIKMLTEGINEPEMNKELQKLGQFIKEASETKKNLQVQAKSASNKRFNPQP
jgi:hypothetical protein